MNHLLTVELRPMLISTLRFATVLILLLTGAFVLEGNWHALQGTSPIWLFYGFVFLGMGVWIGITWKDKSIARFRREWIWNQLTARERTVAECIIQGQNNKQICEGLFIEHNTLKTHIRNIYKKAGCNKRNEFLRIFK